MKELEKLKKLKLYKKSKTITLKIEVPVDVEKRYVGKDGKECARESKMVFDVKRMKHNLKSLLLEGDLNREKRELILDEYVKFYVFDLLGLETVPLIENTTLPFEEYKGKRKEKEDEQ